MNIFRVKRTATHKKSSKTVIAIKKNEFYIDIRLKLNINYLKFEWKKNIFLW